MPDICQFDNSWAVSMLYESALVFFFRLYAYCFSCWLDTCYVIISAQNNVILLEVSMCKYLSVSVDCGFDDYSIIVSVVTSVFSFAHLTIWNGISIC